MLTSMPVLLGGFNHFQEEQLSNYPPVQTGEIWSFYCSRIRQLELKLSVILHSDLGRSRGTLVLVANVFSFSDILFISLWRTVLVVLSPASQPVA